MRTARPLLIVWLVALTTGAIYAQQTGEVTGA